MPKNRSVYVDWPRAIARPLFAPDDQQQQQQSQSGDQTKPGDQQQSSAAGDQQSKGGEATKDDKQAAGDQQQQQGDQTKAGDQQQQQQQGAPDKYTLTIPQDGLVDASDLTRIEELARENNLPNDVAQSMVDTSNAFMAKQAETWGKELEADKTYGGEKLVETQRLANVFLDKFAPKGTPHGDGLRTMLKRGVGNNLYVVAAMANVGRAMQEDKTTLGAPGGGGGGKKSPAEVFYPNAPEFQKK